MGTSDAAIAIVPGEPHRGCTPKAAAGSIAAPRPPPAPTKFQLTRGHRATISRQADQATVMASPYRATTAGSSSRSGGSRLRSCATSKLCTMSVPSMASGLDARGIEVAEGDRVRRAAGQDEPQERERRRGPSPAVSWEQMIAHAERLSLAQSMAGDGRSADPAARAAASMRAMPCSSSSAGAPGGAPLPPTKHVPYGRGWSPRVRGSAHRECRFVRRVGRRRALRRPGRS